MNKNLLTNTIEELSRRRGQWPAICRSTGLDYHWLTKLAQGRINDPGIKKIQRLADFFNGQPAHGDTHTFSPTKQEAQ